MAYEPLHHKYRPQRFDQLVGQEAIAATLSQALQRGRIAPAYLFSGPRGTGKTSSALILARSLNCLSSDGPTAEPCGTSELCTAIAAGGALDVIEIDAASNTGVDNIRDLIERSRFAPVQARWKVYVVDECHMLSTAAFNALLKTLEEPPPRVVFVLATTDPQRVLPTILSRCQRFDFRRIPLQALEQHLLWIAEQEAINITPEAVHLVAQLAQGGLRDAESLLDQLSLLPPPVEPEAVWELLGAVPEQELLQLAAALQASDPLDLLQSCRQLLDRGREPAAVLQGLAGLLRDLVLALAAPQHLELTGFSPANREALPALAQQLGRARLLRWQEGLRGSEVQLRQSAQPRLWLEVLLLGLLAEPQAAAIAAAPAPIAQAATPAPAPPAAAAVPVPAPVAETLVGIKTTAKKYKLRGNIDAIYIDYLQLIEHRVGGRSKENEVSEISRSLKMLAKQLDVPVIALSQLSRAVETRGGSKKPQLSDLRDSGAIEQDADIVEFIYRPEYYNPDEVEYQNKAYVIIAKNRNGSCADVEFFFNKECTRFENVANEYTVSKMPMNEEFEPPF